MVEKKLRIIQVVHAFPPTPGGIETHAYKLSLELARLGAQVVVHTSAQAGSQEVDAELKRAGVEVKRHFSIRFPFFSSLVWMPGLPLFVAFEKGDAVCSHGFGAITPLCAAIGAVASGKRFYWTIHGMPRFRGPARLLVGAYRTLIAPLIALSAKKIICVSQTLADEMTETLGADAAKKIVVIPNGVGEEFLAENGAADKSEKAHKHFTVLFVGRLDRSKGVFSLLDAFGKFYASHKDSALRFVGPDEGQRAGLERMAKKKGLPVEFQTVPRERMPEAYASASVCVLPSEYEGFGLAVLESWACGTPAISTHVGAAPQFFKEAFGEEVAGLFMFDGQEGMLAGLERMYSSKGELKRRWAGEARKALANYSWKEAAEKTREMMEGDEGRQTD